MVKFAVFDSNGVPAAFYADEVHGQRFIDGEPNPDTRVPPEAVEISDEVWQAFLSNQGRARWVGGVVELFEPEAPPPPPVSLCQIAAVRLVIDGFDITGFERSQGVGSAMMLDENTAWVFFEETQADTNYIVTPDDGVTKYAEYFEVLCPGVVTLALIVQRVQ